MLPLFNKLWVKRLRLVPSPRTRSQGSCVLHLEPLECRLTPSRNYYVSTSGDDHNDGLSQATAWRTIDKVNGSPFSPGDTINFQGGAAFSGSLQFYQSGTADRPITITSYGGRATISSGSNTGISLADTVGVTVSNLNIVGTTNVAPDGIDISSGVGIVSDVTIADVDVTGYQNGIAAFTSHLIQNLRITHARVHDNGVLGTFDAGIIIQSGDSSSRPITGLDIDHCEVFNDSGEFGVYLSNVSGGVVEWCEVHDNANLSETQGITAWDSDHIVFQHNEAYSIWDYSTSDGDGFFFGNGVTDSVMQYNYSHENSGLGFVLVANLPGRAPSSGNTVRYNVSENDSQLSPYGAGITVSGDVWDTEVYNNTVYITGNGLTQRSDVTVIAWTGVGLHLRNNTLEAAPGNYNLSTSFPSTDTAQDFVLQGNAYYIDGGTLSVYYPDAIFTDLSAWQDATGQELLGDGTPVGYMGDPQLVAPGQGGTIGDADLLYTLNAYNLQPTSPVSQIGLDLLGLFSIDPGAQDFYGNPLPQGFGFSIGAFQPPAGAGPKWAKLKGPIAWPSSALAAPANPTGDRTDAGLLALVSEGFTLDHHRRDASGVDITLADE